MGKDSGIRSNLKTSPEAKRLAAEFSCLAEFVSRLMQRRSAGGAAAFAQWRHDLRAL